MHIQNTVWRYITIFIMLTTPLIASVHKEETTVKALAKGSAITAEPAGTESLTKNPAGLSSIKSPEISANYGSFFGDSMQASSISIGLPLLESLHIGISVPMVAIQSIPETIDASGTALQTGTFSDTDLSALGGIAWDCIPNTLTIGAEITYTTHTIANENGTGIGFDAGLLWHTEIGTFGLSAQNIGGTTLEWTTGTKETIPQIYNIGFATDVPILDRIMIDYSQTEETHHYNIGVEKTLSPALSIQAGLHDIDAPTSRATFGASLKLENFQLNIAYQQHEALGSCYTTGVTWTF